MIHRAYRSLNDPVKLLGFTALQWLALVGTAAAVLGATQLVGLSVKPAITVCSLVITTVAAIAYASEPGGVQPLGLLRDMTTMLTRPRHYAAAAAPAPEKPTLGLLIVGELDASVEASTVDRAQEVFAP